MGHSNSSRENVESGRETERMKGRRTERGMRGKDDERERFGEERLWKW